MNLIKNADQGRIILYRVMPNGVRVLLFTLQPGEAKLLRDDIHFVAINNRGVNAKIEVRNYKI